MKLLWKAVRLLGLALLVVAIGAGGWFWLRPVSFSRGVTDLRLMMDGARGHVVTVQGIRVHTFVLGPENGAPVVLVHGLGGRSEDWARLAPVLARKGYRVYLPDLPGYGRSEQPANFSYSVPDEAAVVVGLMDALGLKQVDLGGWSMGGWIVQRIAGTHPERVKRLMLFDSAGLYFRPEWNTALFVPRTAAELDQLDALLMPHPPHVPGFVARDILRVAGRNGWVIRRALATMLTGRDVTDQLLPGLKMPVLLVWGSEDRITPLKQGEAIHELVPQSQMLLAHGCGHLAPSQCADQIAPGVVEFLAK